MSRSEKKNVVTVTLTNIVIIAVYTILTLKSFHSSADVGFAAVMRVICMFMLIFSLPTMIKTYRKAFFKVA